MLYGSESLVEKDKRKIETFVIVVLHSRTLRQDKTDGYGD